MATIAEFDRQILQADRLLAKWQIDMAFSEYAEGKIFN